MQTEDAKKRHKGRGVEAKFFENWDILASEQCFNMTSIKYDDGSSNVLL